MTTALLRSWRAALAVACVVILAVVNACSSGTISGGGDNVVAGLRFTLQPVSSTAAGTTFSVSVELLNSAGDKIGSADDVVTLTVSGGASLTGSTSQAAVNGVATFSGLSITRSGTGYTITASANGVNASSSSFTVTPGSANAGQSTVSLNPSTVTVGATITATFTFKDQYGNAIAGKTVSLGSSLAGVTFNPSSGTTNASGVFTTNFIATGAGSATLNATVDGLQINLPTAVTVTAPVQYTIATSSSPANGGTTAGGGTFNSGASVTVTATAAQGFTFTNWTEGGTQVSTSASYQFTATANRTLVANFTASNSCPVGALTIPGTVNGTLAATCMAGTFQSATFRFTATGTGAVGLTATSGAFTPALDVITDPGLISGV
jgi:hypothetical protein